MASRTSLSGTAKSVSSDASMNTPPYPMHLAKESGRTQESKNNKSVSSKTSLLTAKSVSSKSSQRTPPYPMHLAKNSAKTPKTPYPASIAKRTNSQASQSSRKSVSSSKSTRQAKSKSSRRVRLKFYSFCQLIDNGTRARGGGLIFFVRL